MRYQLTPIHCRPWLVAYLSVKLIESHYENNYGGALRRLNAITEQLEQLDWGNTPAYVKAMLDAGRPIQFIDARPWPAVAREPEVMQGATWRDPERVQEWAGDLSKAEPVVVWCAYGFHVGCKTAIALRELGFDAKFMTGGHSAWKAIDGPTKPCA